MNENIPLVRAILFNIGFAILTVFVFSQLFLSNTNIVFGILLIVSLWFVYDYFKFFQDKAVTERKIIFIGYTSYLVTGLIIWFIFFL
jgi:positive regulator of sigma E activity